MISEEQQDQAALYILGLLEPHEAAAFESELNANAELRDIAREFREAARPAPRSSEHHYLARAPRFRLQVAVTFACSPPRGVNSPTTAAETGLAAATTSRKNRFTTFS